MNTSDSRHMNHFELLKPSEIAFEFRKLNKKTRLNFIKTLDIANAADVLENLPDDIANDLVASLPRSKAAQILSEMLSDEKVDILQALSEVEREEILSYFDKDTSGKLKDLLAFQAATAGGFMQIEYFSCRKDDSVQKVKSVFEQAEKEYFEYPSTEIYVLNDNHQLEGCVDLRKLVLEKDQAMIKDICNFSPLSIPVSSELDDIMSFFYKHPVLAVPVVDQGNRMMGIMTKFDVMRTAQDRAGSDFQNFTGISGGEELREMNFKKRFSKRITWLSTNILLNFAAASVITFYEETLKEFILLAIFLPIISDMSGCSGNQSVAVSIRELSTQRISFKDFFWVFWKELIMGLANGLILGVVLGIIVFFWKGMFLMGLLIGTALYLNTILSVCLGGLIPLILKKFKKDPAIASSPILTTLTDMMGFILLLSLVTQFKEFL